MSSKKMVTFNENVDVRSISSDSDYEEAAPRANLNELDFDDGFVDFQHYGVEEAFQPYEVEDAFQRYGVGAVFQRDEMDSVLQLYGVEKAVPEAVPEKDVPEKDEGLSKPSTSKQAFQAIPKPSGPLVYDVPSGKQPMAVQPDQFATWRSLNKWDEDSDSDEPVDLSELYAELYGWQTSDEEGEVRAEEEVKEDVNEEVTIEDCDEDDDCAGTASEEEDEEEEEEDKLRPQPILKYIVELGPEEYDEAKEQSLYANPKYIKFLLESGVALMEQKCRSEALNYWNQCVMNKHAWFNMGVAYETGEYSDASTEPDYVEAKRYYLRAAQQDHPLAIFNLALYYLYGKGPQQRDLNMAHFLMKKAMGLGVEQATEFYEELEQQAAIEQLLEEERAQHLKD